MMTINDFSNKQILFAFLNLGEKLSFKNDNIIIKDKNGKVKHQSTCYRLFAVFIVGHITITTGLIQRSHKFGFPIFFMTPSLKLTVLKTAITQLDEYLSAISEYNGNLTGLLGYEGNAARIYFKNLFAGVGWNRRLPRIKPDYINTTLDIGYSILFNIIDSLLSSYGFDTYCGVLHKQFYMRKSLVCDIIEPFRCIIDKQIIKSIHLSQFKPEDFLVDNNRYYLNWEKNSYYIKILLTAILEEKENIFLYVQSYYRSFMKNKPISAYPFYDIKGAVR